jgi:hypothetical protein
MKFQISLFDGFSCLGDYKWCCGHQPRAVTGENLNYTTPRNIPTQELLITQQMLEHATVLTDTEKYNYRNSFIHNLCTFYFNILDQLE